MITIQQAYRYELDPNNVARTRLLKHAGTARFAWNWALARRKEALDLGERVPGAIEQHREWNRWKKTNASWAREVSKCAPQESLRDLDRASRTSGVAGGWAARSGSRGSSERASTTAFG